MNGPWFSGDATALAAAIVRGEYSCGEALARTLADIDQADRTLGAVSLLRVGQAEARAEALDEEWRLCRSDAERAELLQRRPFFGVPLLIKDVGPATAHREIPSRMGTGLFGAEGRPWPVNGTLTERYLEAGFVPFGRSTSPEVGISATTEARAYGRPTRNPWSLQHSAGGSSGGAAAAVASGMVTIAHANDGAGSIRIPASACGLIGLKPSRGLMPMGPLAGDALGGLAIDHVLSRSVRDCAAALDASAGADAGAPYAAPAWPIAFTRWLDDVPRGLRIGLLNRFYEGDPVHAEVAAAIDSFATYLDEEGHHIEEVQLPFTTFDVLRPVMHVVAASAAMLLDGVAAQRGQPIAEHELEPSTFGALELGRRLSGGETMAAMAALHRIGRQMGHWHQTYDVLLTPVLAEPPALLGRFVMNEPDFLEYRLGPQGLWRYSPFAPLANATGAPAIALPVGRSSSGLPIGAMLAAEFGEDGLLLRLAAQWERSAGPLPLAPPWPKA